MSHTRRIAICSAKGGVGKTALAVNLAANLASISKSTLLLDLSPFADATCHLGMDKNDRDYSIYDLISDKIDNPQAAVIPSRINNLFLIPSDKKAMEGAELELAQMMGREAILDEKMRLLEAEYDFIIYDCPPGIGLLTINALMAATEWLLPVQAHYLALNGVEQLFMALLSLEKRFGHKLALAGIVCTLYDGRTRLSRVIEEELRRLFGSKVFENVIGYRTSVGESPTFGMTIGEYEPGKEADQNFREVAMELLRTGVSAGQPLFEIASTSGVAIGDSEPEKRAVRRAANRISDTLHTLMEDTHSLAKHAIYQQLSEAKEIDSYRRGKRTTLSSDETDELWS